MICVVDGGKRYFKFKSASEQSKIPSLVGLAQNLTLHESHQEGLDVTIISSDLNGHYFVGDLALQSFSTSLSVSKNYCLESEHKILMLTSIALLSPPIANVKILSSLQINDYKNYRQQYISEYLHKTYTIKFNSSTPFQSTITFSEFEVFPQGGADILALPESILQNKKTGVINIGYRDVNCCVVNWSDNNNPKYESSLSFSFNSGIYEAEIALIKRINQIYDTDISIEYLPDFLQRHSSINPTLEYEAQAIKISKRIKQIWQNIPDFNQIFFSGGGSLTLYNYIQPLFPGSHFLPISDVQFGNVLGLWKLAQERFS